MTEQERDMDELLTQEEAAALLGVHQPNVARLRRQGVLASLRRRDVEALRAARALPRVCKRAGCDNAFVPAGNSRGIKEYCSPACRKLAAAQRTPRKRESLGMTLEEFGRLIGATRERVRQLVKAGQLVRPLTEQQAVDLRARRARGDTPTHPHPLAYWEVAEAAGTTVRQVRQARQAGYIPSSKKRADLAALIEGVRRYLADQAANQA